MRHQEPRMLSRRDFLATSAKVVVPAMLIAGCGPSNQGTFDPFRVRAFACNKLRAENNETLTLTWEYGDPELLKMQKLCFRKLHLSGITQQTFDLALNARSFTFQFQGPVTVEIQATTETVSEQHPFAPRFSAALNVNKVQDLFFRASFHSASGTPSTPYLGYTQDNDANFLNNAVDVEFSQFVGFFDANQNGRIDPLAQALASTDAFRALSLSGFESEGFKFTEGPNFPFQSFNSPGLGRTNGMIFAGTIVMTGQPLPYKADDGDGVGRTSVATGQGSPTAALKFNAIFVGIPFLEAGGKITIADIQVGNIDQKLVTTVFTNPLLTSTSSAGTVNSMTVNRLTRLSSGNIKGGRSGVSVTLANGSGPFDALVGIDSLEWQTEYIRDEDILTAITITGE